MSVLQFECPPLPGYIRSGYSLAGPGRRHPERTAIGEFDLLVVKQGCLYVGEEERHYEVAEGHALILRPDLHHYPTAGTKEPTASYWLHFGTVGAWQSVAEEDEASSGREESASGTVMEEGAPRNAMEEDAGNRECGDAGRARAECDAQAVAGAWAEYDTRGPEDARAESDMQSLAGAWTESDMPVQANASARLAAESGGRLRVQPFAIRLPQFTRLAEPGRMYELLELLTQLESGSHLDDVRWRQQRLFQEVLALLADSLAARGPKPGGEVADRAASYLRLHYAEPVTAQQLGAELRFHPVYIARCMRRRFGCAPMEYLLRYRLEQAKRLLLQTDLPILRIARETGFQQAAYFTSCFRAREGLTPRAYRNVFHGRR